MSTPLPDAMTTTSLHDDEEQQQQQEQCAAEAQAPPLAAAPTRLRIQLKGKTLVNEEGGTAALGVSDNVLVDAAAQPIKLKAVLKGNPAALQRPTAQEAPQGGEADDVTEDCLAAARTAMRIIIATLDAHDTLAKLIGVSVAPTKTSRGGRRAPVRLTSSTEHLPPPPTQPTRRSCSVPYFHEASNVDACAPAREELLRWHRSVAEWRRRYWYSERPAMEAAEARTQLDKVFKATFSIQRHVEWELHVHIDVAAFRLRDDIACSLHALDRGLVRTGADTFREPVDTVQYPDYLPRIGDSPPCCMMDMYDFIRGAEDARMLGDTSLLSIHEGLNAMMDVIDKNCKLYNGASSELLGDWRAVRSGIARELKGVEKGAAAMIFTRPDGTTWTVDQRRRKLLELFPSKILPPMHSSSIFNADFKQQLQQQVHAPPSRSNRRGQKQVEVLPPPTSTGDEDDGLSLVERRKAQLVLRKETIVVNDMIFEQAFGLQAQCDTCDAWHDVTTDVSGFDSWTCDMIGKECQGKGNGRSASAAPTQLLDDEVDDTRPAGRTKRPREKTATSPAAPTSSAPTSSTKATERSKVAPSAPQTSRRPQPTRKGASSSSSDASGDDTTSPSSSDSSTSTISRSSSDRAVKMRRKPATTRHAAARAPRLPVAATHIAAATAQAPEPPLQELIDALKGLAALRSDASDAALVARYKDLCSLEARVAAFKGR